MFNCLSYDQINLLRWTPTCVVLVPSGRKLRLTAEGAETFVDVFFFRPVVVYSMV